MVTVQEMVSWETLETRVRETTLLEPRNGELVYPYEEADIRLERVSYTHVLPTSLYVVRSMLARQVTLANDLSVQGHDPLELEGALVLKTAEDAVLNLTPPIVEATEWDGQYVLDGAHRTGIGLWAGRAGFLAIHVSGIRPDCPSYALPNEWYEMRVRDEVPKNIDQKKRYRHSDPGGYASLYRDFSALNGSAMREPGS